MMKDSQNLYAETLLKTLGARRQAPTLGGLATRGARDARRPGAWPRPDSCRSTAPGLSRYNYVTPEALVAILAHVDGDERLREPFEAALPVAGRDGTLAARMRGTRRPRATSARRPARWPTRARWPAT